MNKLTPRIPDIGMQDRIKGLYDGTQWYDRAPDTEIRFMVEDDCDDAGIIVFGWLKDKESGEVSFVTMDFECVKGWRF
jgi:hypothetical protein